MSQPRILIIEDEPLIRMFVVDSLEDSGFQVEEAENAAQALAKLAAGNASIDAIIIDVGLPDRPGDKLAGELRAQWTDLPIIIASGRDRHELARQFSHDDRVVVVGKPYTADMLLDALRDVGVSMMGSNVRN